MTEQATSDTAVDTCVTVANRSSVGVLRLPYINSELWWHTKAKLMTPMAWKIPGSTTENRLDGSPFREGGTCGPSNMTEPTMMIIPQSARLDARESLWMSRYSESG